MQHRGRSAPSSRMLYFADEPWLAYTGPTRQEEQKGPPVDVRIYADEAGTHGGDWLIIGMLFVPDHGPLHSALCASKENHKYYNAKPRRKARYKENTSRGIPLPARRGRCSGMVRCVRRP